MEFTPKQDRQIFDEAAVKALSKSCADILAHKENLSTHSLLRLPNARVESFDKLAKCQGDTMQNLITISKTTLNGSEINSVNSREIHSQLEVKTPYSMWIQRAIEKYAFVEGEDFTTHKFVIGKTTQIDYIVTLDMAKELCMLDDSEKGRSFRKYFIDCEKQFNTPLTFEEMAKQTIFLADKRIKELEYKIETDKPLVSFAKSIEASVDSVLVSNYAKLLSDAENITIGQNKLFPWLRYAGYLMNGGDRHNVPYQKYIDNGYFEVSTSTFAGANGTHQRFTAKITGKGQIALAKKIVEAFSERISA